jgi:hypothetical protein
MERPGADSEEKREPVSDIDTAVVDSLKVLDLKWPIREADIRGSATFVRCWGESGHMRLISDGAADLASRRKFFDALGNVGQMRFLMQRF